MRVDRRRLPTPSVFKGSQGESSTTRFYGPGFVENYKAGSVSVPRRDLPAADYHGCGTSQHSLRDDGRSGVLGHRSDRESSY